MTQLVRIGNSRGIRIPSALIEQARLDSGELIIKAVEGGLLIQVKPASKNAREGWAVAFDQALAGKPQALSLEDREWLGADLGADE